ncbi:retrovirus-related Pol polyprotein from transposon opus [Trichonephila clavipes]|nr:retrovirus-related Pol polyprotein from transposon opus [Trichonephila clavipes]
MGGGDTNKEHYCKNYLRSVDENFLSNWVPKDNLYRPGYQFYCTIELTQAFQDMLGASPRFSTPGHPESMGAVERWNRTLKDMLNKNIQEHGNEWDVHLPYLLFAYREIPHTLIRLIRIILYSLYLMTVFFYVET